MSIQLRLLTKQELECLLSDNQAFESSMNLHYEGEDLNGHIRNVFTSILHRAMQKNGETIFESLCLVLNGEIIVGSLALRGFPLNGGYVEVGYGLGSNHRGKRIMTEALRLYLELLHKEDQIHFVIAHTDPQNIPSQRVLEKNGFLPDGIENGEYRWKYTK